MWLLGDWRAHFGPVWGDVLLTLASLVCGIAAGAERERRQKSAGVRTITLVTLGAAVFGMISYQLGADHRVAQGMVSGIGFIGGGAILQRGDEVRNLTTAAIVWAFAAIGLTVGAGYGGAGLALTALELLLVTAAGPVEERFRGPCRSVRCTVRFHPRGGRTLLLVEHILAEHGIKRPRESWPAGADLEALQFDYCDARREQANCLDAIARVDGVVGIERLPLPEKMPT